MNDETWVEAPLDHFLTRATYGFTNPMPTTSEGPYMVTAKDINDGRILYEQARRTSREAFIEKLTDKSRPNIGDVLVTKDGTLGRIALVDRADVCVNQSVAVLQPKSSIRSAFLKLLLEEPKNHQRMLSEAEGSTIKHIYVTRLAKQPVRVPQLHVQDSVLSIISPLERKIELNRKMNATLEAMARALFRDWFVDFGPTRAKMEGRAPYLSPDLWALFPDRLDGEGKPEGWEVRRVDQLMELAYGKALKANDRQPGVVPVYGSGGITGSHSEALVQGPSVIVGRKGTVGSLYWEDRSFFPIDTVFYVRPFVPLTFCFYALEQMGLDHMNTDAAVPGLNRNNVYRLEVAWPEAALVDVFDAVVSAMRAKIKQNTLESRTLAQTRDLLLPRLLSGELRVADIASSEKETAA